jgi:UDP-N-acetylmuramoyl-tripeptide--D-alanyl-D-alanine ligase
MITLTLAELAAILGTESPATGSFTGLSKDTRTLQTGNLYIAIIGETLDGHDYTAEAYQKGASAALVSRAVDCPIPQIIVPDTIAALGKIAQNWRDRFSLPLVGVTGSNGKTTLKNMIAAILVAACNNDKTQVLATEGNLNNNIGLPLVLSRLTTTNRYGVIEMGMNHFGEIAYLTKITRPQVAIVNNAAEAHLQGLENVAGVAKAKGEIFSGLQKNGVGILNKDDAHFDYWRGLITETQTYLTFALKTIADITATYSPSKDTVHQLINIQTPKGEIDVNLPLLGEHNVMNALAATAAGIALDINLEAIKTGLETVQAAPGRLNQHMLPNNVRVIDDTYNANPFSTTAAINALALFTGKKILVLGDMRELGTDAKVLHEAIGKKAQESGIDYLFTLGELSAEATTGFGTNAQHFTERNALIEALIPHLSSNATLLVKGSRSMHMEKVLAGLIPAEALPDLH